MTGSIETQQRKANRYQTRSVACSTFCMVFKVPTIFGLLDRQRDVDHADASDFLRKYPWPGRLISDTFDDSTHRTGNLTKRFLSTLKIVCGKTGEEDLYDEVEQEDERVLYDATEEHESQMPFYRSLALQQSFRQELEK
jgi:hypothetical protein